MSSSSSPEPHLWITILAGGSGTRFWPASTPGRPKQLLPLAGEDTLIADTMRRALGLAPEDRIRILTGNRLVGPFKDALGEVGPDAFLVEPEARGTGPVLVWAAWSIAREDPSAVLVSLHADHAIQPPEAFHALLRDAAAVASSEDVLLTVAIPPTRPETGFGYIRPGEATGRAGTTEAFRVRSFVEKPDLETAERYVSSGYLWNSGIFVWKAGLFLQEVRSVAPELGSLLPLLDEGKVEEFFRSSPVISVDEAVLERSSKVAFVRATFQWDDVGSWEALARTRPSDGRGNVLLGSAHAVEARGNIVMAEEGSVVLFGVDDLVVVRSGEIVLVADRRRTPDLKSLLNALPAHLRDPERP
jgi:mannose-1-phosphate guanylyltransferase